FMLGKFLAHLATLVVSVALGSLISLAILALGGLVSLDAALWLSYMTFLLSATLFAALFLLLSMGVSVLARNSATSLVFLVTIWTLLIVVIPQASYLVATQTMQLDDSRWDEMNELQSATWESLQREGSVPRAMEIAAADGYAAERRFARRMREIDGQVNRLRDQIEEDRWEQFRVARRVNLLSPGYAFQYSVEALLGSGLQWMENFGRQGHRYREHLQKFLRARDESDPTSPHIPFLQDFMSQEELDPSLIPRFQSTPVPLEQRLETGLVPITSLLVETILALFFALWAFHRAELSGGEQVG
ncbi:MAG: ABC transporter permease subunit, partial [Gemmatimonadetes bacterium]|nr:ABC transporter permease subunit [Gemmatimonadota bacterium]